MCSVMAAFVKRLYDFCTVCRSWSWSWSNVSCLADGKQSGTCHSWPRICAIDNSDDFHHLSFDQTHHRTLD